MDFSEGTFKAFETSHHRIALLTKVPLDLPGLETYVRFTQKMNILAVSETHRLLFIACRNKILCFRLTPCPTCESELSLTIPPNPLTIEGPVVNYMKIGYFKGSEILIVATMAAQVLMYNLDDLSQPPANFDNYYEGVEDNSTWSCDLQGSYLCAGSNSTKVSVWEIDTGQRFTLNDAHVHNVPCVEFSPSGRYIASTSIDSNVTISSREGTVRRCRPSSEWGWNVKWIKADTVDFEPSLPKSNISNLEGRYSTQLTTHYYNSYATTRGQFNALNFMNFLRGVSDRLEGLPEPEQGDVEGESMTNLTSTHPQSEVDDEELSNYLLLHTSRSSLHLIDPNINPNTPGQSMHVLSVFLPSLEITPHRYTRLALVEYVPELSLVLLGNQGGSQLFLLRIVKSPRDYAELSRSDRRWQSLYWTYSFTEESHFNFQSNLIAMAVGSYCTEVVRVYCLTENGTLHLLQIKSKRFSLANLNI